MCKGARDTAQQSVGTDVWTMLWLQSQNLGKVRSVPPLPHLEAKLAPLGPTCQPSSCQMFLRSARDVWGAAVTASAEPASGRVLSVAKLLVLARLYTTGSGEGPPEARR